MRLFNFYHLSCLGLKATFIFYGGVTLLLGCVGLWAFVGPMRSYQCAPSARNILCSVVLAMYCKMHVQRVPWLGRFWGCLAKQKANVVLCLKIRSGSKHFKGGIHKPSPLCPRARHLTPGCSGWAILMYKHQLINDCFLLTAVAFIHFKSSTFPVLKVVTKQAVTMETFVLRILWPWRLLMCKKNVKRWIIFFSNHLSKASYGKFMEKRLLE